MGKRRFAVFLLVGFTFLACLEAEDKGTDLTQLRAILTGRPPAELERKAADILKASLKRFYGVEIPVNPEGMKPSKDVSNVVLVGKQAAVASGMVTEDELAKVKHDGYVIRAENGKVALAGYRDRGTVYAAYGLLERLGYRFYAPGCESLPDPKNPVIPDFQTASKPFLGFRSGGSWEHRESIGDVGDPRQGANPELFTEQSGSTLWIDHTAGYLVPRALYYEKNPEYFALRWNGERIPKTTRDSYIHLCLSNPDVQRISAERALKWMQLQPERRFFCITVGDGVDWCQCDQCKAMDVVPGNYSDRLLKWVNGIAREVRKEFPDNILLTFGYCGTDTAPEKERPGENVWVLYCPYWGVALSMVHPLTHPANTEARQFLEGWLKVAPNSVGIYDYNMYFSLSWDAMARKVKWYAEKGCRGIWHCGRPQCFSDLFTYVISRLEWDPSQDPQRLKEEFVAAYYGPAAPYVSQYLRLVETRLERGFTKGVHEFFMPPEFYSYEFMVASMLLFGRMRDAAAGDSKLLGKVEAEWRQLLGDYRKAVTLQVKDILPAERELALKLFKEHLAGRLEQDKSLAEKLPGKLPEGQAERLEKERKDLHAGIRGAINHFAGTAIPGEKDAIEVVNAFLKDPEAVIRQYPAKSQKTEPEKLANGVRLPATAFEGGFGPREYEWFCEPRMTVTAYAGKGPRNPRMWADFVLDAEPAGPAVLKMEGQDADKDLAPKANVRVTINGKTVFEGPCRFVKRGWSWDSLKVEKGLLKQGKNRLELENTTPSARLDHYWFMISEAQILFE
jgi:hypothetical protein